MEGRTGWEVAGSEEFLGDAVVLRKLQVDGAAGIFGGVWGGDVYLGDGLGGFEGLEGKVSSDYCAGCNTGNHDLCPNRFTSGIEANCCCGMTALLEDVRINPVGFTAPARRQERAYGDGDGSAPIYEKVPEGGEDPPNRRRLIQARPATRKLERGLRKAGIGFFRQRCAGCGLAALLSRSAMNILTEAAERDEEIDVICDRCIENYPGRVEEEYTEEQKAEGVHVARILNARERRN